MRRLTALLIRLAFSASARFPSVARTVALSRFAWSSTAGSASTIPGSLSQRSFSLVGSSRPSCFMVGLGRITGVTGAHRRVVDAEVWVGEHDVVQRRVTQTQRGELGLEVSLVAKHELDVLDAHVSGTHDLVHGGARLANAKELGEIGQTQELAPQRTAPRRERLEVLEADISKARDERVFGTLLAELTQLTWVNRILDLRPGIPRA